MRRDMTAEAQDASNSKPQSAGPGAGVGACAEDPQLWLLEHEFWLESRGKAARLGAGAAGQWGTEGAQIREVTMETHPRPKPEALEPSGCGQGKGEGGRGGPWPGGSLAGGGDGGNTGPGGLGRNTRSQMSANQQAREVGSERQRVWDRGLQGSSPGASGKGGIPACTTAPQAPQRGQPEPGLSWQPGGEPGWGT